MEKIFVQIYELQDIVEAETVAKLGVDRIGSVIVSQEDWKMPAIKEVGQFAKRTKIHHSLIPLFSDVETVLRVIEYYEPPIIHFCDSLVSSNGRTDSLEGAIRLQQNVRKRFPNVKMMRSIPIPPPGNLEIPTLEISSALEEYSDIFLTDTWLGNEPVEGFIGITGKICNWKTATRLVNSTVRPVILAGGLSPENVYEGIMAVRPFGVDSCTQTNQRDSNGTPIRFKKDIDRVRRFVQETRRAQHDVSVRESRIN